MKIWTDVARRVFALLLMVISVTGLVLATSGAASAATAGTNILKSNVSGSRCLDVTTEDGVNRATLRKKMSPGNPGTADE